MNFLGRPPRARVATNLRCSAKNTPPTIQASLLQPCLHQPFIFADSATMYVIAYPLVPAMNLNLNLNLHQPTATLPACSPFRFSRSPFCSRPTSDASLSTQSAATRGAVPRADARSRCRCTRRCAPARSPQHKVVLLGAIPQAHAPCSIRKLGTSACRPAPAA
jgi:hypothetical protein